MTHAEFTYEQRIKSSRLLPCGLGKVLRATSHDPVSPDSECGVRLGDQVRPGADGGITSGDRGGRRLIVEAQMACADGGSHLVGDENDCFGCDWLEPIGVRLGGIVARRPEVSVVRPPPASPPATMAAREEKLELAIVGARHPRRAGLAIVVGQHD
jgi:hypothetical protein